jgi:dTMP kinase
MPAEYAVPLAERIDAGGGVLVAVEGVSRSGKSTLIRELAAAAPRPLRLVQWNSHDELSPVTAALTARRELSGLTSTLLFLADLRLTFETVALPALQAGEIVVYDRYFYTAWVRGLVRAVPVDLLRSCAAVFPRPDLTLLLEPDMDETAERFLRTRRGGGWFGVGRDVYDRRFPDRLGEDDVELAAFRWFNGAQLELYRGLAGPERFVRADHVREFQARVR